MLTDLLKDPLVVWGLWLALVIVLVVWTAWFEMRGPPNTRSRH